MQVRMLEDQPFVYICINGTLQGLYLYLLIITLFVCIVSLHIVEFCQ